MEYLEQKHPVLVHGKHAAGYQVVAHVESPEGGRGSLENGVDSIEHGAKLDDEMIRLFKEKNEVQRWLVSVI